jgi:hypothetical protein
MYAESRRRLFSESRSEWMECAGTYAIFNGIDSPVTQTFGLGLFEEPTPGALDTIKRFFLDRGAPVVHEVSPHAGVSALDLLCRRRYQPVEISNVMYRGCQAGDFPGSPFARVARTGEKSIWSGIMTRGWTHDHPEYRGFAEESSAVSAACECSVAFLAGLNGQPGAAGTLGIHEKVALFAGGATIPEMRCCGLQRALIEARMHYACENGCDLLMLVAEPGSNSQRNAERNGFQVAYTRTKWRLSFQESSPGGGL